MFNGQAVKAKRSQTPADYAALFNKYYGSESIMQRILQARALDGGSGDKGGARRRPASASASLGAAADVDSHARRVDQEIATKAVRETRAKYLTPYLAHKYNVGGAEPTWEPPHNPATDGLRMVSANSVPKEVALAAADKNGAARVMELAAQLEEAEKQRARQVSAVRQRNAKVQAARVARPQPTSSSFRATTREQAQYASSRSGLSSAGSLGPGSYNKDTYFTYMAHNVASPMLGPKDGRLGTSAEGEEAVEVASTSGQSVCQPLCTLLA